MRLLSLGIPRCASNYVYEALKPDFPKEHYTFCYPDTLKGHWKPIPEDYNEEEDFCFAVVRNPFDLLVSSYEWNRANEDVMKGATTKDKGFKEWLKETIFNPETNYPSSKFLFFQMFGTEGRCKVDYIARLETLDEDLVNIAEITGRRYQKSPKSNTSERDPNIHHYYDDESQRWIRDAYSRELMLFSYVAGSLFLSPIGMKNKIVYDWPLDKLTIEKNV